MSLGSLYVYCKHSVMKEFMHETLKRLPTLGNFPEQHSVLPLMPFSLLKNVQPFAHVILSPSCDEYLSQVNAATYLLACGFRLVGHEVDICNTTIDLVLYKEGQMYVCECKSRFPIRAKRQAVVHAQLLADVIGKPVIPLSYVTSLDELKTSPTAVPITHSQKSSLSNELLYTQSSNCIKKFTLFTMSDFWKILLLYMTIILLPCYVLIMEWISINHDSTHDYAANPSDIPLEEQSGFVEACEHCGNCCDEHDETCPFYTGRCLSDLNSDVGNLAVREIHLLYPIFTSVPEYSVQHIDVDAVSPYLASFLKNSFNLVKPFNQLPYYKQVGVLRKAFLKWKGKIDAGNRKNFKLLTGVSTTSTYDPRSYDYCLREGSGRFRVWTQENKIL